ncbi:MAG: flippase-like domain-containing protein [Actinobacteria bacterium]|nr:flippase-like domain-containing protein [Actinomycetota bacterium]
MTRMRAVQAAVSLVALAAVVWWATRQERPDLPATATGAALLALALALYAIATVARGERWHRILERAEIAVPRPDAYRLTAVGYMGNNVLPARGGDLLRTFLVAPLAGVRKRSALGTVVAERLLDAAALALIFLVVVLGVLRGVDVPGGARPVAGVAVAVGVGLAGAALVMRTSARLRRVRELVRPLAAATGNLASVHGVGLLALSLVVWALEASVYLAAARAVELPFGPWEALYVVALTNLFALVPAGPGYVGTFDAAVLFAAGSLGAAGGEAVAYLLLLRFVLFVPITLGGFAFLVARYGGVSRLRAGAEGEAALR